MFNYFIDWLKCKKLVKVAAVEISQAMGDHFVQVAQANCPVDTGELISSIAAIRINDGDVQVVCTAPHTRLVEFGHMVTFVFGREIEPIYIPPVPFFRIGIEDTRRAFPEIASNFTFSRLAGGGLTASTI